jgi:1-acyl-sn-glycerol-3-phosphate acyltransferase
LPVGSDFVIDLSDNLNSRWTGFGACRKITSSCGKKSSSAGRCLRNPILYPFKIAFNFCILVFGLLLLAGMLIGATTGLVLTSLFVRGSARKKLGRITIMRFFRFYLGILHTLHIIKLDLRQIDKLHSDAGLILAPNHPSLLDALLVTSRLPNVVCIMKAEVLKNVLFGKGAQIAGYIPNGSLRNMVNSAAEELAQDNHVLLFPEGTRTVKGAPLDLKGSLGVIAKRTNAEVQTLIIEVSSGFLGKERHLLNPPDFPVHFCVRLGKRFPPPDDAKAFMDELEDYFCHVLNKDHKSPKAADAVVDSVTLQN